MAPRSLPATCFAKVSVIEQRRDPASGQILLMTSARMCNGQDPFRPDVLCTANELASEMTQVQNYA